jgi:hypothetical protein
MLTAIFFLLIHLREFDSIRIRSYQEHVMFEHLDAIDYAMSIECYTCSESSHFCSLPLNLDGGDESNENNVDSFNYDSDHFCEVNIHIVCSISSHTTVFSLLILLDLE